MCILNTVKNFGGEKILANHNNSPTCFRQYFTWSPYSKTGLVAPAESRYKINGYRERAE